MDDNPALARAVIFGFVQDLEACLAADRVSNLIKQLILSRSRLPLRKT